MDWLDISVPISEHTPVFSGDPTYHRELASAMARGDICNVSRLDMGVHTGTHIDAPRHFIEGAPATEDIPLDACMGAAFVVDATALRADDPGRGPRRPDDPGRRDAAAVQDAELRSVVPPGLLQ